jgi:myo-inositol-1(or 4)-monophosphatase
LAYVAEGVCDVYYEESIRLWDVAAGLALVQAAGGIIRMKTASDGKPMAYDVSAGNPGVL